MNAFKCIFDVVAGYFLISMGVVLLGSFSTVHLGHKLMD